MTDPALGTVLRIENTNNAPMLINLLVVPSPGISKPHYSVTGQVRYENVQGDAYLEMWNHFPPKQPGGPEAQYFSRTLAESGEMGKLRGTSDWRPFRLPFNAEGAKAMPDKLTINVYLPAQGTVWIGPLTLTEYSGGAAVQNGAWWSPRMGGIFGGIAGALLGCLGGLAGSLAAKGKARGFVMGTLWGLIIVGALCLATGIAAIFVGQSREVWLPLTMLGVLVLFILPMRTRQIRNHYHELELRRIAAMDAR